jgi:hypothetical protein
MEAVMLVYVHPRMKMKMEFGEGLLRHQGSDWPAEPALLEDHEFAPITPTRINITARVGCEDCTANFGGRERGGACISFVSFGIVEDDEARSVEKRKRGTEEGPPRKSRGLQEGNHTGLQQCRCSDGSAGWKWPINDGLEVETGTHLRFSKLGLP